MRDRRNRGGELVKERMVKEGKKEQTKQGPLRNPTGEGKEKGRRSTGKGKDGQGGKKGAYQERTPEEPTDEGKKGR